MTQHSRDVTEAAPTAMAQPLAYEYDDGPEWTPPGRSGPGWVVAGSVLVVAFAAVAGAVAVGVNAWTAPVASQPPSVVQAPVTQTHEYRSPALLHPDQDTAFLQELDRTGTIYDTAGIALHNARMVCKMIDAGWTEETIVARLTEKMEIPELPKSQVFVSIAIQHYCPPGPVT